MPKFIISYCPDKCVVVSDKYEHLYKQYEEEYEYAMHKLNKSPDDLIPWNNSFWTTVEARNAAEAVNYMLFIKLKENTNDQT